MTKSVLEQKNNMTENIGNRKESIAKSALEWKNNMVGNGKRKVV